MPRSVIQDQVKLGPSEARSVRARCASPRRQKRIAIVQSNYIPWKGYFDLIDSVDEFILLDCVQFTKRDWRNRNTIQTPDGPRWLTIPVVTKGRFEQRIDETVVADPEWARKHWLTIERAYRQAPHFRETALLLAELYRTIDSDRLSVINRHMLTGICSQLGITTRIRASSEFDHDDSRSTRLVSLCRAVEATEYVSGPAAQAYLDEGRFLKEGIAVRWFNYEGYREYGQLGPAFTHNVSIIDVMFNAGPHAIDFVRRQPEVE